MKKILSLTEEESNRILELHKNAVLNEQKPDHLMPFQPDNPLQNKKTTTSVTYNKGTVEAARNSGTFSKYPCVLDVAEEVYDRGNGTFQIIYNGFKYFDNGRKQELSTSKMSNYTCNDPEFQTESKSTEGSTGGSTGVSKRPHGTEFIKKAQKLLGMPDAEQDGKFGADTLKALEAKLGVSSNTPTPPPAAGAGTSGSAGAAGTSGSAGAAGTSGSAGVAGSADIAQNNQNTPNLSSKNAGSF